MIEQYLRKVQDHGTGKEIRIPPEVCEKLCITDGGEIQFDLEPDVDVVTLRKPGGSPAGSRTSSRPGGSRAPGTRWTANGRDQVNRKRPGPGGSPMAGTRVPAISPAQTLSDKPDLDDDSDDSGIRLSISFED